MSDFYGMPVDPMQNGWTFDQATGKVVPTPMLPDNSSALGGGAPYSPGGIPVDPLSLDVTHGQVAGWMHPAIQHPTRRVMLRSPGTPTHAANTKTSPNNNNPTPYTTNRPSIRSPSTRSVSQFNTAIDQKLTAARLVDDQSITIPNAMALMPT